MEADLLFRNYEKSVKRSFIERNLPIIFASFVLLNLLPFIFVKIPPLIDLPGHMARYAVQLNLSESPELQANWSFQWALVGNLGFDILIQFLAPILGIERATWLLSALIAPVMLWGLARISKAIHGCLSPLLFFAAPFAVALPFQWGFLNYCLACGLAFHLFASWVNADRQHWRIGARMIVFIPGSMAVWICHAYGWAIFAVMAGGYEIARTMRGDKRNRLAALRDSLFRLFTIGAPLILTLSWRNATDGAVTKGFFDLPAKAVLLLTLLRDQNMTFDLLSIIIYLAVAVFIIFHRSVRLSYELVFPALLLFFCELLIPGKLFGSSLADARLWPVIFQLVFLAPIPASLGPVASRTMILGGGALAVMRVIFMTQGYVQYDRDYARHLQALNYINKGASIVTFTPHNCVNRAKSWRMPRLEHLDGLAVVRLDAFINSEWIIPGAQLLSPRRASGTKYDSDPSQIVNPGPNCDQPLWPEVERRILEIPRSQFDYLWLIGFDMANAPEISGATRIFGDDETALYRLQKKASEQ